jgi:chorismate lyase / 3-hydroxybenzoate synthase
MTISQGHAALQVTFNAEHVALNTTPEAANLQLPLPLLAGPNTESIGSPATKIWWDQDFLLTESETLLIGAIVIDAQNRLETPVERAYQALLHLTRGWHLYRIWNYIPNINEIRDGLECYQQFNIGRWTAFESCYGRHLRSYMPAASAVGLGGDKAVVVFKAGRSRPEYLENPSQIPAYHYPAEYGPRPPCFARGVVATCPEVRRAILSGTASIEGHRSIGQGDWARQFQTTQQNIEIMLNRMQVSAAWVPDLWPTHGIHSAHFKCYLRHPEALPLVRKAVRDSCGQDHHFSYVLADICRSDLDLEIEGRILTELQPECHEF